MLLARPLPLAESGVPGRRSPAPQARRGLVRGPLLQRSVVGDLLRVGRPQRRVAEGVCADLLRQGAAEPDSLRAASEVRHRSVVCV